MGTALMVHEGGCLCGRVRYRTSGEPLHVVHCHCAMCRRASGAPFVTWATFSAENVSFAKGKPAEFASSPQARRGFCSRCGSPLSFRELTLPEEIDLAVGAMDDADAFTPQRHIWTSSKLGWVQIDDGLPQYPRGAAEGTS